MALVILICMVLMVLGGVALFALVGRALTRRLAPPRRRLVTVLMALAGAGLGWLLVLATFYQSSLWPPPRLRLVAPPRFDGPAVILLEDPRAARTLEWRDSGLPFTAATAETSVPPTGIVRVRSFGQPRRGYFEVIWSDGRPGFGAGGGSGPPGTGGQCLLDHRAPRHAAVQRNPAILGPAGHRRLYRAKGAAALTDAAEARQDMLRDWMRIS